MWRKNKLLFEIQRKQLSRISKLVYNLRQEPEEFNCNPLFEPFKASIRNYISSLSLIGRPLTRIAKSTHQIEDEINTNWNAVLYALSELISESVWPE